VASVSNVYFAGVAGYFDGPSETKPLLHTWSLGVEEQFYLLTPLFMMFAWRQLPRRAGWLFAAVTALSLAAALALYSRSPTYVFYLLPFRAWELALGALLAIRFIPAPSGELARNVCGAAGLLLLFGAVLFGSPTAPLLLMTGLAAVGATLVIASSERGSSLAGLLLSLQPLVFIGLISYSLYLWHWPLIVFQRTDAIFAPETTAAVKFALIAASIGIAFLSWRFVERPFRAMARSTPTPLIFGTASGAMASTVAACAIVLVLGGAPFRFPKRVVEIGAWLAYDPSASFRTGQCFLMNNRQQLDVEACAKIDPARPNYLLLGDSHAAHLWFGLASAIPQANILQATASLCRPLLPHAVSPLETRACPKLMQFAFNDLLSTHKVDKVLLAASWKDEDLLGLVETLDELKARGVDVIVLGPIVEYDAALPRLLVDEIIRHDPHAATTMRRHGVKERDRRIAWIAAARGATYLSLYDAICRDDHCDEFAEGDIPMQFDLGHLTDRGSIELARRLSPQLIGKTMRASNVTN
jgi:peptidoglycan/LPS O-acetylase OafA/YrhL